MTIGERIKQLRKNLNLTLEKFGEKIGITKASLSTIENNKTNPSEQTMMLICREFNVNENWLRTGEGEMFNQSSRKDEISKAIEKIFNNESNSFKERFISALVRMNESDWNALEKFILEIVDEKTNHSKNESGENSEQANISIEEIDRKLDELERLKEKKLVASLSAEDTANMAGA